MNMSVEFRGSSPVVTAARGLIPIIRPHRGPTECTWARLRMLEFGSPPKCYQALPVTEESLHTLWS